MIPALRTRKARKGHSQNARKALRQYDAVVSGPLDIQNPEAAQEYRVQRLLWAIALLNRALAMETRNGLGDCYATAATVRRDLAEMDENRERRFDAAMERAAQ